MPGRSLCVGAGCARLALRPSEDGWIYWQYHKMGRVDGIEGDVDLNVLQGGQQTLAESFAAPELVPSHRLHRPDRIRQASALANPQSHAGLATGLERAEKAHPCSHDQDGGELGSGRRFTEHGDGDQDRCDRHAGQEQRCHLRPQLPHRHRCRGRWRPHRREIPE